MPVKLSETPMLYQPMPNPVKLERDLEMFSDPEQYDQDDPKLQAVKAEILAMMDPGSLNQTEDFPMADPDLTGVPSEEAEDTRARQRSHYRAHQQYKGQPGRTPT